MLVFPELLFLLPFVPPTLAQLSPFPPARSDVTVVTSKNHPDVSLSYKKTSVCETTPNVNSYAGFVHLPPNPADTHPYPSNFFFWFFESRDNPVTDPFTIWLGGGPGYSSLVSVASENGPCSIGNDSNSTVLNPWSWNNHANILYIDQPLQTGYSYDKLTNGTLDQVSNVITPADFSSGVPQSNETYLVGTFASQRINATANTTESGAMALWHFAQVWLSEFPHYRPVDDKVNLWTESYGGRYGPLYTAYFNSQNAKIETDNTHKSTEIPIHIESLGLVNGCIDMASQGAFYPKMAYNNTYDIQAITRSEFVHSSRNFTKAGGCLDASLECRRLAKKFDPENLGISVKVNQACELADIVCDNDLLEPFSETGVTQSFDITQQHTTTWPPPYLIGFFNQQWVQADLGVPVNFTVSSNAVTNAFISTGDVLIARGAAMEVYRSLLEAGVRISMMYGDKDFQCNWLGGENVSLHFDHRDQGAFRSSGYADLVTNSTYNGGVVRQHGNLSFARVFQAGHLVPGFQPETAYRIYERTISSFDVATGKTCLKSNPDYSTHGPSSSFHIKNKVPAPVEPICYTWQLETTCTPHQQAAVENGAALIKDWIVQKPEPALA